MTQLDDQGLPVCTGLSMRGAPESIPAVGHNSDVTHEAELRTLIGEISRAHMKAHLSAAQVHDAMLEAGRKLIRLRAICSDLEWRSLKTIVGSERTTRRYMALARECAVSSDPHKMHQRLLDSLPIPSDDDVPKEGGHLSAPSGSVQFPAQTKRTEMKTPDAVKALPEGVPETRRPWVTHNTHYEEWYTPRHILEAAREALGGIDFDPASSALANETVKASAFLTVDDDALNVERRWPGRVWLNPPYAMPLIERFVGKLVSEYEHPDGGTTSAILLVNNCTETQWFHLALNRASSVCLPRGRLNYLRDGTKIGGPMQGQSLFYFGPDPLRFEQAFREIGRCVYPNKQELNEEEYAVVKLSTREELEEWILRDYGEEALREFRADR